MKTKILGLVFFLSSTFIFATSQAMRLDFYHSGNASQEMYSLDRVVLEPLPWPGNPQRPVDDTNRGKYLFELMDLRPTRPVFSRGFASIYVGWEPTVDA